MPSSKFADDGLIQESASLCARDLDGLGEGFLKSFHGRENDFLRLGKSLDDFNNKALAVSGKATELAERTSGEEVMGAARTLSEHLDRLEQVCGQADHLEISELDSVASVGALLMGNMRDFARLVKHLTMLGIATRIESARLGSQGLGFSTLADDVEKLAGKIVVSSDKILKRSQALVGQCQEAGRSIADMNSMRASCSLSAMDLLRSDLDALHKLMEHSVSIASGVAEDARLMVSSVSEAVLSMQFHDIIRQQLEHVAEATDEARTMALEGPMTEGGHNAADWPELTGWILSVLKLQDSQLGNARERFTDAMQTLGESLVDIAGRVESMAGRAGSLADRDHGQGGVLRQIEGEVANIAVSLRDFSSLEQRMAMILSEVGDSIAEMSSIVAEIEEVGSEIELIAINASIKAAHTGDEGRALGVLASAIQKLSVDARGQTERIMELLASVDSAALVRQEATATMAGVEFIDGVVAELDRAVADLKNLDLQTAESAAKLQRLAAALSLDVGKAVESLDFRHDLARDMAEAQARIEELTGELERVLPPGVELSHSPKLLQMLDRYTMDAERLVHENVLGTSSGAGVQGDDEYGDNVELF